MGGGGTDSDALLWKAAVVAAGGTVSDARLSLVSTLIGSLKSASVWTLLDRLWLMAAENSQSALIDLVARASATAVNSPTFTADRGYAGNGTTSYVNTNYNPNTNKVALSLNSAHMMVYTNLSSTLQVKVGCATDANTQLHMFAPLSTGAMFPRIHTSDGGPGLGSALGLGLYIGDRISSASIVGAYNGADLGTNSTGVTAIPSLNIYTCGAYNNAGTPGNPSDARHGAFSVGGSLGSSGRSAVYSAVSTYMTAVGA